MITAVFDTNVVVSGLLSPGGSPGKLLDAILDGHCRPVVNDDILEEYEDVLCRPRFKFSPLKIQVFLDAFNARALQAPFTPVPRAYDLPDPDDLIFLAAAISLKVPIVTGNLRHFPGRAVGRIPIYSPAMCLARLCDC